MNMKIIPFIRRVGRFKVHTVERGNTVKCKCNCTYISAVFIYISAYPSNYTCVNNIHTKATLSRFGLVVDTRRCRGNEICTWKISHSSELDFSGSPCMNGSYRKEKQTFLIYLIIDVTSRQFLLQNIDLFLQ